MASASTFNVNVPTEFTNVEADPVQPVASVTKTLYVPEDKPVTVVLLLSTLHNGVKAPLPPLLVTVALPSNKPQLDGVFVIATIIAGGCVIFSVIVLKHNEASVTKTVYDPPDKPVDVAAFPPAGDQV